MSRQTRMGEASYTEFRILPVSDALTDGRRFRIFAVVDDHTRECLALVADCLTTDTPDALAQTNDKEYETQTRKLSL